jgi:hypothetical protein
MARKTAMPPEVSSEEGELDEPGAEEKRVPLEDLSLRAAFHDRIDETAPRFPPGDDHEGRIRYFG